MNKNSICVIALICVVILLLAVLFIHAAPVTQDDLNVTPTTVPTPEIVPTVDSVATPTIKPIDARNVTPIDYTSLYIKTSEYFGNMQSPAANIVTDITGLKKYISIYNDEKLKKSVAEFDEKYFVNKSLIILAIQETSGSNINTLIYVVKVKEKVVVCKVERHIAEIGTSDMAMNYFIIQVNSEDIANVEIAIVR